MMDFRIVCTGKGTHSSREFFAFDWMPEAMRNGNAYVGDLTGMAGAPWEDWIPQSQRSSGRRIVIHNPNKPWAQRGGPDKPWRFKCPKCHTTLPITDENLGRVVSGLSSQHIFRFDISKR